MLIGVYAREEDVFREVGLRFGVHPCLVRLISGDDDRRRTARSTERG